MSGKTQEEAKSILEAAGFKIGNVMTVDNASIEKDQVVNTDPAANSKQTKGTIITLYISSGMTKIPDGLVGQAKDSVIAQLKQAGLTQITIESEYSDSVQSGAVTRIDPGSGSTVEMGTAVTIWVSTGKQQVSVPFVVDSTLAEAKSSWRLRIPGQVSRATGRHDRRFDVAEWWQPGRQRIDHHADHQGPARHRHR